jgi:hypothetical protein
MSHLDDEPKKPTQVPPGDLADAVGTHEESDFDEGEDEDSDDEGEDD